MSWSTLIGRAGSSWAIAVLNDDGQRVANIVGSESYVLTLSEAMCKRRSVDVSDLLVRHPRPRLRSITGGARPTRRRRKAPTLHLLQGGG